MIGYFRFLMFWRLKRSAGLVNRRLSNSLRAMIHSILFLLPASVLIAIITLSIQRKHLLIALLALEGIILSLTLIMASFAILVNTSEIILALVMLSFGACEARLGLACLVAISRIYGNDLCNMISIYKW